MSSRSGQIELASRGSRIASLKLMNDQLRMLGAGDEFRDDDIERSADLDALQDILSQRLVDLQRASREVVAPGMVGERAGVTEGEEMQKTYQMRSPYGDLAPFLQRVIERLSSETALRRHDAIDELIDNYAAQDNRSVSDWDRESTHAVCAARYRDFEHGFDVSSLPPPMLCTLHCDVREALHSGARIPVMQAVSQADAEAGLPTGVLIRRDGVEPVMARAVSSIAIDVETGRCNVKASIERSQVAYRYTLVQKIGEIAQSSGRFVPLAAEQRGCEPLIGVMDQDLLTIDTRPGFYYVTTRRESGDGVQMAPLAGPFMWHTDALLCVAEVKRLACESDSRAVWYQYGTARMPLGPETTRTGHFNAELGSDMSSRLWWDGVATECRYVRSGAERGNQLEL